MCTDKTDLTFFTNDKNQTLLDRFKAMLSDTRLFDILVGYFHASGFYQLYDALEPLEKIRILVGLGVDETVYRALYPETQQGEIEFESHARVKSRFRDALLHEIEHATEPDEQLETGLKKFMALLQADCPFAQRDRQQGGNGKRLEIRAFPSRNLHAKVYIGRFAPEDRDYGFVITGSSNFSYSGLVANREFNVELRQRRDVQFALNQFEALWAQSVDLSWEFVQTIQKKTWLNDTITPYELYLKLIYEYLQEDINLQEKVEIFLPPGFIALKYQKQAVIQALKKLEEHQGVFLSDVVGLGKTFITAQLLQQVRGRILVICPPGLKDYWEESLHDFRVPAKVESLGKLDQVIRFGLDRFDYVVVDEAHRFRNESTQAYADLLDLCRGKKVILVTATPLNNTIEDLYAQLKLFQRPKDSTIPGIPNLEKYFQQLRRRFKGLDRKDPAYRETLKAVSDQIRDRILKHIMVRRTRTDVLTYFREDLEAQGLFFPEVADPRRILYQFEGEVEVVFQETIGLLQQFRYSRYIPLLYYNGTRQLTAFEKQQQRNVGGFMKSILIKRLESSFHAFRQSVGRFIQSYERFIEMFEAGTVYISRKTNVYELLDSDDLAALEKLVEEGKAQKYPSEDFQPDFASDLRQDLALLRQIQQLWKGVRADPKLERFSQVLATDPTLQGRKLILFTESQETATYLFDHLRRQYPGEVLGFSSRGGQTDEGNLSPAAAREQIRAAFDPSHRAPDEKIRILITTDVLSEGINLHRANLIINYDLPWNPTRVLQRVGRINRLGTVHQKLFIYNGFPTTQADAHLGLEANIINKIQLFHNMLGEDAKYLSDGEEIGSQELFDTLSRKQAYLDEEAGDSELEYLAQMRKIRDEDPALFERIKRLPKRARSGRLVKGISDNQLITFFRIGKLKKFYCYAQGRSEEITFFEAARRLECKPDSPRHPVPADYHHLLACNRRQFEQDAIQAEEPAGRRKSGRSNLNYIEKRLKEKAFRNCAKFTDADEAFLAGVRHMLRQGTLAKKVAQQIKQAFDGTQEPLEMLAILRKHIRTVENPADRKGSRAPTRHEVILSGYQIARRDKP